MKPTSMIFLIGALLFFPNCGDYKTVTTEKKGTNNLSSEKKLDTATNPSEQGDVVGEWEMASSIVDTNDNLQIDEDERKNLKPVNFKDYMKLNRDGTGHFTVAKMDGRYEITDKENNGKKYLTWYDKANGEHRVGTIIKVTKDELHIKEPGGNGLFLWKRL